MVIHTFKSVRALNIRKMPYVRGKFNRQYIYMMGNHKRPLKQIIYIGKVYPLDPSGKLKGDLANRSQRTIYKNGKRGWETLEKTDKKQTKKQVNSTSPQVFQQVYKQITPTISISEPVSCELPRLEQDDTEENQPSSTGYASGLLVTVYDNNHKDPA